MISLRSNTLSLSIYSVTAATLSLFALTSLLSAKDLASKPNLSVSQWELDQGDGKKSKLTFQQNGTVTPAFHLGMDKISRWEIKELPKGSGKYVLRLYAGKKAGWHIFRSNSSSTVWSSRSWPKYSINKK